MKSAYVVSTSVIANKYPHSRDFRMERRVPAAPGCSPARLAACAGLWARKAPAPPAAAAAAG